MGKRGSGLFVNSLLTGMCFTMGLVYGVDPSDVKGTLIGQLVPTLDPSLAVIVGIVGFLLSLFTLYGLATFVEGRWDHNWIDGVAAFCGLLAGGLTLVNVTYSIPFWVFGMIMSVI